MIRSTFLSICFVLAASVPALATTMQPLELSELTYVADLVAEADVVANSVEKVEGKEYLRTATTLRLTHVIKGSAADGDVLDVLALGGELGGEVTTVHSTPVFTPDERVLVFLEQRAGAWHVVGLSQGKITLVQEPGTGRDILVKVAPPRGLQRFDEEAVQLPLVPEYFEDILSLIVADLHADFVPTYRIIAGLPAHKDAAFRAAAKLEGKFDARWEDQ
ncbi:MAG: hypothetical protein GY898_12260 [Proteobacteria bacterium]|nr:hypothetical protein [Pseudomonadota bacterium]